MPRHVLSHTRAEVLSIYTMLETSTGLASRHVREDLGTVHLFVSETTSMRHITGLDRQWMESAW